MGPSIEDASVWQPLLDGMVDKLKADGIIRNARVERALRSVPRHEFLRDDCDIEEAYRGEVVRTLADRDGGTLSTASHLTIVARMLEAVDPRPGENVLEIGLGTGYNAALLAELVRPGVVTAIDNEPSLVGWAQENMHRLGIADVRAIARDGWLGDVDGAPYDAIIATVGVRDLSPEWVDQLRDGGRLLVPLFISSTVQPVVRFRKRSDRLIGEIVTTAQFIMLKRNADDGGRYVIVDETVWEMRDASERSWEILRALLAEGPTDVSDAPELDPRWPIWFGLEEPNAVITYSEKPAEHRLVGVFEPDVPGLAVVERKGGRIRSYGGRATYDRFVDLLARMPELPPVTPATRAILDREVIAVRHGTGEAPPRGWLLERPNYDVVVRMREA